MVTAASNVVVYAAAVARIASCVVAVVVSAVAAKVFVATKRQTISTVLNVTVQYNEQELRTVSFQLHHFVENEKHM